MKLAAFQTMKDSGLFALCRRLTRRGVRILCYHGASLADEHRYMPKLFMSPPLFAARMRRLLDDGYRIVTLDAAKEALEHGDSVEDWVVLTIDDGWYGTYRHMLPVLRELRLPATLYVTTYYVDAEAPVFNVLVAYLLRKAGAVDLHLGRIDSRLAGRFALAAVAEREQAARALIALGDRLPKDERHGLTARLAEAIGIDIGEIEQRRICSLMTREEIRDAARQGLQIQLHTHRHRFPPHDEAAAEAEIVDNRRFLEHLGQENLAHFCYPSGIWDPAAFGVLRRLGIRTATTCDRGINYSSTPRLALRRILDGDDVAPIEFDALLSGVYHFTDKLLPRAPAR